MPLGDYIVALEMRDILQKLVKDEVEKQRPRYQMATVTAIDRVGRKCTVQFPGDTSTATVNMGSIQPNAVGQVVRVDGLLGDRYISDVMGPAYETLESRVSNIEASPDSTSNVLPNGSFEQGFDNWTAFWGGGSANTNTVDTNGANAAAGGASWKWTVTAGTNADYRALQHTALSVTPGEVLYFSYRIKKSGSNNMRSKLELQLAPDEPNANYFGSGASFPLVLDYANAGTSYGQRKAYFVVPSGMNFMRFSIVVGTADGGAVNGDVWVDDVQLRRVVIQAVDTDPIIFAGTTQFTGPTWAWDGLIFPTAGDTLDGAGWQNVMRSLRTAAFGWMGGGVRTVTSTGVSWSQRFLSITFGKAATGAVDGTFQIDMPTDGTVITGVGGAADATVAGGLIPLSSWQAIYYIPPYGSGQAFVPANLRIAYFGSTFSVPNEWVLLCLRNNDTGGVVWSDGQETNYWRAPTLGNSWVNYVTGGWDTAAYKKENGIVWFTGLIKSGLNNVPIFTLPVGYRPRGPIIRSGIVNVNESNTASTGTAHTHGIPLVAVRIDILATGEVQVNDVNAQNGYLSLADISFPAGG